MSHNPTVVWWLQTSGDVNGNVKVIGAGEGRIKFEGNQYKGDNLATKWVQKPQKQTQISQTDMCQGSVSNKPPVTKSTSSNMSYLENGWCL